MPFSFKVRKSLSNFIIMSDDSLRFLLEYDLLCTYNGDDYSYQKWRLNVKEYKEWIKKRVQTADGETA